MEALEFHGGAKTDKNIESHLKALFGGSVRFNMIQEQLKTKDENKIYIVTNNGCEELIYQMANCLMQGFLADHVISMPHVQIDTDPDLSKKLACIKGRILQQRE